ncbi:MAG: hypothetical protein PHR87_06655 [Sulfurospirillaceae bacterium]|nr:hypothetical protein [Sulfurospirillaceae bacterium]
MRSAMSMIELVFAIVIMGIAVMSLPLILTQVQSNNAFAMQQEAILAAKAKIGDVLTYEWDDRSYSPNASSTFVLDVTHGDAELNAVPPTPRRVGHIDTDYRRKFFPNTTNATLTLGSEGGDLDDVDDFTNTTTSIAAAVEGAGTLDYVFDLNLSTTVSYANDSGTYSDQNLTDFTFNPAVNAASTNIKTIEVKVSGGDQNITLRAFTCNIGESTLLPSRPYR